MGKWLKLIFPVLFIFLFSTVCFASQSENVNSLVDAVPEMIEDFELSDISHESLNEQLSFKNIFVKVLKIFSNELGNCSKIFFSILSVVLLFSMLNNIGFSGGGNTKIAVSTVSAIVIFAVSFSTVKANLQLISQAIESAKVFSTATIPVVTALSVSSAKTFGGVVFSTATSFVCGIFQYVSDSFLLPITVIYLMFGLVSGFTTDIDLLSICSMLKKLIKWVITSFIGIFTTALSFQNILSNSTDNVVKRSIQNAVGKFIPVVGSTLSGALDSMFALAFASKVTVSVFGVVVIVFLFLPLIIGNLLYGAAVCACKYISSFFKVNELSNVLTAVSDTFFLFSGICSACTFMLIASYLFLCIGAS